MIWKNYGWTEKSSFGSSSPRSVTGGKPPVATGGYWSHQLLSSVLIVFLN